MTKTTTTRKRSVTTTRKKTLSQPVDQITYCPVDGTKLVSTLCPDDIIRPICKKCGRLYQKASYIGEPLKVHEWVWM